MLSVVLSLLLASSTAYTNPILTDPHMQGVRSVSCIEPVTKNLWWGTMFHIGTKTYMSAFHVANGSVCWDSKTQAPLSILFADSTQDYVVFKTENDLDNVKFTLACKPATIGARYTAIGWPDPTKPAAVQLTATAKYSPTTYRVEGDKAIHLRVFNGAIIPGMSGGLVIDKNWVVYAINNASDSKTSFEREIKDTLFCS
jgi:hypothetical protein